MTRHLSELEIRLYRARALSASELLWASDHVSECGECRGRIAAPAELHELERNVRESLSSVASAEHLSYEECSNYVEGELSNQDMANVKLHLQGCPECAGEISELEALKAELRAREENGTAAGNAPEERVHSAADRTRLHPTSVRERPSKWGLPRLPEWLWQGRFVRISYAAAIPVLVVGLFLWQRHRQDNPENLLAMAYTEERPFEFRLGDNGYGPVRQHRAGEGSALDRPNSLVRAEAEIQQNLQEGRDAPEWLFLRGRAELLEQQYDAAIESLTRAHELKPADPSVLGDLGCAYALRGDSNHRSIDHAHAIELLRKSLTIKPRQPVVLFNLALVYERVALIDEAAETWKQFLSLDRDNGWAKEAEQHLSDLEARKKTRARAREQIKPDAPAFLALARADTNSFNGELFQEIAWREWLPRITTDATAAEAFHALAQIIARRSHDTALLDAWNAARPSKDISPLMMLAEAMKNNGAGEFDAALPVARAAARLLMDSGNRAASLRAQIEIAISRQRSSAEECLAVAVPLIKDLDSTSYSWMRGQALIQEGNCHNIQGELELANRDFLKASAILDRAQFPILQLRAQGGLGAICRETGNFTAVWEITDKGLQKCWALGAPSARAQQFDFDLAEACRGLEWYQAAAVFGQASVREIALTGVKPIEAVTRVYTASLLRAAGDSSGASAQLAGAEEILRREAMSPTNQNLLLDTRLTRAEMAPLQLPGVQAELRELQPAMTHATWEERVRLKQALGRSLAAAGDDKGAKQVFQDAISEHQLEMRSISDPLARISGAEIAAPAYKGLMSLQLERENDPTSALRTWDSYRVCWVSRSNARSIAAVSPEAVTAHKSVRLVYVSLPEGLAAFSVRSHAVSGGLVRISTQELQQVQQRFLRSCARPESDLVMARKDARQLYGWLIEPFRTEVGDAQALVIDADGWIAGIPFSALVDANGRYLVEDFTIAMSGPPALNTRGEERITSTDRALIVSVPSPGGHIPPLMFATEETRRVAMQLRSAKVLSGAEASMDALKTASRGVRVFHFAGHGWSNAGDGGLILATEGSVAEPSYLTASALARLDWSSCSLVVLSACMTGTGEARGPFNSRSLVRAFLASGARRVVAARWNLDEEATAILMKDFYASVVNSRAPAESLAMAERFILHESEYRHPYYWASFAIFGDQ